MLNGNEAVAELSFEAVGPIEQAIEGLTQIKIVWGSGQVGLGGNEGLQLLGQAAAIHPSFVQHPARQALLVDQGGEQVFGFDLGLAFLLGELLGGDDGAPGLFSEQLSGGLHGGSSFEGFGQDRMAGSLDGRRGAPNRPGRPTLPRVGGPSNVGAGTALC